MKKLILISLSSIIVISGAIYFFVWSYIENPPKDNTNLVVCVPNDKTKLSGCINKKVVLSSIDTETFFEQAPMINVVLDPVSGKMVELEQTQIDTAFGVVIVLSKEKINCPRNVKVTGKLSQVGDCKVGNLGKNMEFYCNYAVMVDEWSCEQTVKQNLK